MNKLLGIFLLCLAMQAGALELEGAKLENKVQVDKSSLVLNGTGVRSILFFKMYVAGLYLPEKVTSADVVLASKGAKRIALHVVVDDAKSERFLSGFRKGIEKNHSDAQLVSLRSRMEAFDHLFEAVPTVKRGDTITLDWMPEGFTRISLNGVELGRIQGDDFYRALLSIWIGAKPVSDDLKKGLLGG